MNTQFALLALVTVAFAGGATAQNSTTASASTSVVNGKTNGIAIRQTIVDGQPLDVDVQVFGTGANPDLGRQIDEQVRAATQQALAASALARTAAEEAGRGFAFHFDGGNGGPNWIENPSSRIERAAIVTTTPPAANVRTEWQEDLNVMAQLLEDSVNKSPGSGPKGRAMGIQLKTFGAGQPAANLYLEGHGAVFQLNVSFPLVELTKIKEPKKTNSTPDSAWDQTRRRLYGAKGANAYASALKWESYESIRRTGEFDTERVAKLTQTLVETLKEASHIRHLKSDENITVVVNGPGSTLTLTARKSAVDDFAKGKLDADAFRKKVTVTAY